MLQEADRWEAKIVHLDRSLLNQAGVTSRQSLGFFTSGRLGSADRMSARATRDFDTLARRIQQDTQSSSQKRAARLANQVDIRDERLKVADRIRANVGQVKSAWARQEALQRRLRSGPDAATAAAAYGQAAATAAA